MVQMLPPGLGGFISSTVRQLGSNQLRQVATLSIKMMMVMMMMTMTTNPDSLLLCQALGKAVSMNSS